MASVAVMRISPLTNRTARTATGMERGSLGMVCGLNTLNLIFKLFFFLHEHISPYFRAAFFPIALNLHLALHGLCYLFKTNLNTY